MLFGKVTVFDLKNKKVVSIVDLESEDKTLGGSINRMNRVLFILHLTKNTQYLSAWPISKPWLWWSTVPNRRKRQTHRLVSMGFIYQQCRWRHTFRRCGLWHIPLCQRSSSRCCHWQQAKHKRCWFDPIHRYRRSGSLVLTQQ